MYFSGKTSVHTTGALFPTEGESHGHGPTIHCVVSKLTDVMHKNVRMLIFLSLHALSFTLTQKTSAFHEFFSQLWWSSFENKLRLFLNWYTVSTVWRHFVLNEEYRKRLTEASLKLSWPRETSLNVVNNDFFCKGSWAPPCEYFDPAFLKKTLLVCVFLGNIHMQLTCWINN